MNLHPTRSTFHVALAGTALVALGCAARVPHAVAFGGAMILVVAAGRAFSRRAVTRFRTAGFEMVWTESRRVVRMGRGETITLRAELRNRGPDDMRAAHVRPVASSMLEVKIEPASIDLPAGFRSFVDVHVTAPRTGRWGLHGVALEVRSVQGGSEGLYEVPLLFANPFGVEVFPRVLHAALASPRGGRARRASESGRPTRAAGEGEELRELREHVPGDAFKRIAWKASAKRGQLLVREMENDARDVVWLVVDASVELWAGPLGRAPLDATLDDIAGLAVRHLEAGDRVGLVVFASRIRSWIEPDKGMAHGVRIGAALASAASMVDDDRTELGEREIAERVAEHVRPLDPRGLSDIASRDLEALAVRADALRSRAPFTPRTPHGGAPREQRLRLYLASFGVEVPPKLSGERAAAEGTLAQALASIATTRPRPTIVYVRAPAPSHVDVASEAVHKLRRARAEIRWDLPHFEDCLEARGAVTDVTTAVDEAVRLRTEAARVRAERLLRKMGVPLGRNAWYPRRGVGRPRAAS